MAGSMINHRSTIVTISLLILIVGLGSFLRFYNIGKLSFWLDEAATLTISKSHFTDLLMEIEQNPNMSLYYVFAFFWTKFFPNASDGTLRALSALMSIASIPVVYLLGRTISTNTGRGNAIGFIAAFLVSVNAFNIQYAQEFRSYSLTFLLSTLSTLILIKAVDDDAFTNRWFVLYIIVAAATVYSHLFAIFLIAAHMASLTILLFEKHTQFLRIKKFLLYGFGLVCLLIPITILVYLHPGDGLAWLPSPTIGTLKSFSIQITGNQGKELLFLYMMFGCIGFFQGEGFKIKQNFKTGWKFLLIASCLFIPFLSAIVISLLITPIFQNKYLLYVMPYLTIITSSGIVAVANFGRRHKNYKFFFITVGISAIVLFALLSTKGIQHYYENIPRTNWRQATEFLRSKCSESLRLYYAPYIDVSVLHYDPSLNSQESEWWINILSEDPNADELAASLPNGYNQVCLVLAHAADQNQQRIVQDALQKKFPNVYNVKYHEMEIKVYKR